MRITRKWPLRLALAAAALVCVAVPVAWATDRFSDVATASPHHDNVNRIANAGITGGCAPGLYCPASFVRRDEMASFLARGLPRMSMDFSANAPDLPSTFADVIVEEETMQIGVATGTQYTYVTGFAQLNTGVSAGCPCTIQTQLIDSVTGEAGPILFHEVDVGPGGDVDEVVTTSFAFEATPGSHDYELHMSIDATVGAPANMAITSAAVMVTSAPFNQFGDGFPLGQDEGRSSTTATTTSSDK